MPRRRSPAPPSPSERPEYTHRHDLPLASRLAAGLAFLTLAGCAGSQVAAPPTIAQGPPVAPAPAAAAPEELPATYAEVLPNGMRLIVQDHRASDIVAVYLWVGVGVRYEPPGSARLRPLPGAHALQGHRQVGAGLRRPGGGRGGREHERRDVLRLHQLLHRGARASPTDLAIELLADMAFRSSFDPRGDRARARGDLRGGAHRGGQPAHRHRPPALRAGLRATTPTAGPCWALPRP